MTPEYFEKENYLLRNLLRDLARLITELFDSLPPEIRELENSQRLMGSMRNISIYLDKTAEEDESSIQTPRNS
jgi:hypothetical protein